MPKVRAGADKWQRRSSQATQDYAAGIAAPRRQWSEAARASEDAYNAGVQEAISRGAFGKGITPEAQQTYQQRAQTLGQQRYAPGITASKDRYNRGFEPYRQVIESTTLPPRGRRGDPANFERARAMGEALHNAKMGRSS